MTATRSSPRPRPRSLWSGAFFVLAIALPTLAAARPAAAQEPDTVPVQPPDSARMQPPRGAPGPMGPPGAQDTAAADTVLPPPETLPALEPVGDEGWVHGIWEWDRQDLLRLPDLSLLDLLERIPGLVPVRADISNQPEAAAVFGLGAGAIRYVLDGFVLDPLTSPTFDPSRLSLLALERVRVERRVTGATVRLETLTPDDARTKSVIEAGTGDYGINLFRGIFLPPRVLGGPLGVGFERLAVEGFTPGVANHNVTWLKWTWARDSAGVQLEYRQSTMDRSGVGASLVGTRSDWIVRARSAIGPVIGEAYVGGTSVDEERGDTVAVLREGGAQAGLRLHADIEGPIPTRLATAARLRSHPRLPAREVEASLEMAPLPWLRLRAEALQGWWTDHDPTGRRTAGAALGPVLGLAAFGEVFDGGALAGAGPGEALPAASDSGGVRATRDGFRAGLRFRRWGLALGAAALRLDADTLHGFGLPFEPGRVRTPGTRARGLEVSAELPTGIDPLTLTGWYVRMDAPGWLYLPEDRWRAALVYHHLPLASGNLEVFARLEHVFRGRMNVPASSGTQLSEAYQATNLELTIRILTVRAFLRWQNLLHRLGQSDIPGFRFPGQRLLWGVKWEFWN
ncbi:MAG: hypothetical protein R3314_04745 [Longimicrobiales bacterium]|nr:hypothetical protein [Longimicrobiales bacterium]